MRKYFEFYSGIKIKCGEAALTTLGEELTYLGCKAPILLSSANAIRLGATEKAIAALDKKTKCAIVTKDVPQEISLDVAREIKALYLQKNCDGIIAVGGDGVMDTAKMLRLFLSQECDDLIPLNAADTRKIKEIPLVMIPTENGSGKESTGFLEYDDTFLSSRALTPDLVIIDEDVAMAAPTRTDAACGMYALANAIEASIGAEEEDPSDIYAEKAIRILKNNLESAVKDGENEDACRAVALASTLAGIAYGNNPFGAAHALAEALAEISGEPIEEMIGITLAPAMKFARNTHENRIKPLLLDLTNASIFSETPESERAQKAAEAVAALAEKLRTLAGIPTKISHTKISRESFGKIAEAAANKRAAITALKPLNKEDFLTILNDAY